MGMCVLLDGLFAMQVCRWGKQARQFVLVG
jgi:hypothetical protein